MFTVFGPGHAPRPTHFKLRSFSRKQTVGGGPLMRVAMISHPARPLGSASERSAGTPRGYVAALSSALAELGHDVRVYTRRNSSDLPAAVRVSDGVQLVHVPAGPPRDVPGDLLLPY